MSFADGSHQVNIPLENQSAQKLSNAIYVIANKITNIQRAVDSFGSKNDSTELRHQVYSFSLFNWYSATWIEETKELIKPTSRDLKSFMEINDNSQIKISQKRLSKDFEQIINKFQHLVRLTAQKSREIVTKTKAEQQILSSTQDELQEDAPLLQHQQFDEALELQIQHNEILIQEREGDLEGLERSILEVNEIFRDLGTIVNEQQYLIDNIESNVMSTIVNVTGAESELRSASNYQSAAMLNDMLLWSEAYLETVARLCLKHIKQILFYI
ncbi:t-SNARE [Globomyces pollinis-pini]|nr:t-SNARE [Globomyces pollinis-pini]